MCGHDRLRDRQAEPRSAALAGAGPVGAGEPLEQLVGDRGIDTRAVVVHAQHRVAVLPAHAHRHRGPGGGVGAGVGEQVRRHLMQAGGVAGDVERLVRHIEDPLVLGSGRPRVGHRLHRDLGQIDRAVDELLSLIEPGQQQKVLHEVGHPHRLRLDPLEGLLGGLRGLRRVRMGAQGSQRQLREASDRGQRGAQLVTGVGDERPHPLLVALTGVEGGVHVVQERVQRVTDPADLGVLVGLILGHPLGDGHLALGQRLARDACRRRGDGAQRRQRAAHDPRHDHGEEDESSGGHEHDRRDDRGDRLLHTRLGHPRVGDIAERLVREHPVVAEPVDRHGGVVGRRDSEQDVVDLLRGEHHDLSRARDVCAGLGAVDPAAQHEDRSLRLIPGLKDLRRRDLLLIARHLEVEQGPRRLLGGGLHLCVEVVLQHATEDGARGDRHHHEDERHDGHDRGDQTRLQAPPAAPANRGT